MYKRYIRSGFLVIMLLAPSQFGGTQCAYWSAALRADEPASPRKPEADSLEKYRTLLLTLDAWLGKPVAGKKWAQIPIGYRREYTAMDRWEGRPAELVGWLMAEGPAAVTVLTDDGDRVVLPTARGLSFSQVFDPNTPVAGTPKDADFAKVCRAFLDEGLPNPDRPAVPGGLQIKVTDGGREMIQYHAVRAAQLGAWARQSGDLKLAAELFDRAAAAHAQYEKRFTTRGDERSLSRFLSEAIGSGLWVRAIRSAHGGRAKRADLQAEFERLAGIPGHPHVAEAKDLARGYADLSREDRAWTDQGPAAVAKLSTAEQAVYWVYRLRDHDAAQQMYPGHCNVLAKPLSIRSENGQLVLEDVTTPALELKRLGMAAVPALIARMDDTRPTRCMGQWRSFSNHDLYLLRYGDCCQQIFEAVTGHRLPAGGDYPIKAGKGKEYKAAAEKWYAEQLNKR